MSIVGVILALVFVAFGVYFIVIAEPYKEEGTVEVYKTKIAGVNMRTGTRAFAGLFIDCQLVPEPENPHDANAIKIVEVTTGTHMGYIPAKETQDVRTFLRNDFSHTHRAYIEEVGDTDDSFLVGEIEITRK
jgi:hypothetical protein